jgi:cell division protein FtsZ
MSTNIETIQLGLDGLGAGSNPDTGRLAAEYSSQEIQDAIEDADIVVIVAGFGGGTGTGAAPFIAELAKKMGKLVIGFITKPFLFEGLRKLNTAQEGLKSFIAKADTTIVLSNQLLFSVTNSSTSLNDAYLMIDRVSIELVISLINMLKGIAMMNVDFADFKKATQNVEEGGIGIVGFGEAVGIDCDKRAVDMALSVPLFEPINNNENNPGATLQGANHILIHIVSEGTPITLSSLENIVTSLTRGINKDASVKVGVTIEENKNKHDSFLDVQEGLEQKIKIIFIATGFQKKNFNEETNSNINVKKNIEDNFVNANTEIKNNEFIFNDENNLFSKNYNNEGTNNKENQKENNPQQDTPPINKKQVFKRSFLDAIKNRFN